MGVLCSVHPRRDGDPGGDQMDRCEPVLLDSARQRSAGDRGAIHRADAAIPGGHLWKVFPGVRDLLPAGGIHQLLPLCGSAGEGAGRDPRMAVPVPSRGSAAAGSGRVYLDEGDKEVCGSGELNMFKNCYYK